MIDGLAQSLGDRLQVTPGQATVGGEALGEDHQVAAALGERVVVQREPAADAGQRVLLGRHRHPVGQGRHLPRNRLADAQNVHSGWPFPPRRLCCPAARPVLRPPPTPSRRPARFPAPHRLLGGAGRRAPQARFGRGGPPQFPPPPSERSAPRTPDSPSRLRFQDLHRFHGLHRDYRGWALSCPLPTRQASLDATDRSVAPTNVALDAGLRPGPFPDQTASLLPGSLAITRTDLHRQATTSF